MVFRSRIRFLTLALVLASLALGLWAALRLIGWSIALPDPSLADAHGVLMVNGVLAGLIGIERAVALERRVFYLAPLLSALGGIALALGGAESLSFALVSLGAAALIASFLTIFARQPALYTGVMVAGAFLLLGGNVLGWDGLAVFYLIPWWGSFLILVIAAERLELTRVLPPNRLNRITFGVSAALTVVGCVVSASSLSSGAVASSSFASGFFLTASGWVLLAIWLFFNDIAYRSLTRRGLPRFTGTCLLLGYVWLLVGGAIVLYENGWLSGLTYDAGLHAIFLGFVLSLIFAHALVIVPAVVGRNLRFRRILYLPLAILEVSLAVRILADFSANLSLREWAGLFNVVAILLFGVLLPALYVYERSGVSRALLLDSSAFYP